MGEGAERCRRGALRAPVAVGQRHGTRGERGSLERRIIRALALGRHGAGDTRAPRRMQDARIENEKCVSLFCVFANKKKLKNENNRARPYAYAKRYGKNFIFAFPGVVRMATLETDISASNPRTIPGSPSPAPATESLLKPRPTRNASRSPTKIWGDDNRVFVSDRF